MALATQCPHCHTTFKVAHDQLKLRSGLVRCGACKQIFNGIENLVAPEQAPKTEAAPVAAPVAFTAPPALTEAPAQATPAIVPSSADALEFIPVDDPETQTRILDANEAPNLAQEPALPDASTHPDDDPLTRMTLVDFSIFDEDTTGEATQETMQEPVKPASDLPGPDKEIAPDFLAPMEPAAPEAAHETGKRTATDDTGLPKSEPALSELDQDAPTLKGDNDLAAASEASLAAPAITEIDARQVPPKEQDIPATASTAPATALEADSDYGITHEQDPGAEEDGAAIAPLEDDGDEPDFVTSERRRQRRRRILRIVMAIGSIVLLAVLLLQAAYAFRDLLAVRFPQARPLLSRLCDAAGCQILLPAQIDQVSIESNELQMQAANKNVFTLSLLLRNRSAVPQAWPYIELTLNDKDGKALLRRVLAPKEYLPVNKVPAEGIPARSEQTVNVSFELNQLQASDYRVYLFYP